MSEEALIHTYQTRINVGPALDQTLGLYARLMSTIVRTLFASAMAGHVVRSLKKDFLVRFGITARQFNACCVEIEGKIKSIRQLTAQRIQSLKECIDKREKRLAKGRIRVKRWW